MERFGVALGALCAIVTAASTSSASATAANPLPVEGTTTLNCLDVLTASASVSRPNTTVAVTCAEDSAVQSPTPSKSGEDVYLDADCTQPGVLSTVCPGATLEIPASGSKGQGKPTVNVLFPQLPPSAQVVCLKCHKGTKTADCKAVINVAAASPQGPQACAVPGARVTLQINEAGGSAEFACGKDLTLMPSEATKAYADDCSREETLKDMTRSPGRGNYVTLRVDKLKKKKMCYLCKQGAADAKQGGEQNPCTIYVEVSAATRPSSSVALACVAAVLHFI